MRPSIRAPIGADGSSWPRTHRSPAPEWLSFSSSVEYARLTQPYNVKLACAARLRDVHDRTCSMPERVIMHDTEEHIEATESRAAFGTPPIPTRPITWSMTAKAKPHRPFEFESVLLAIAGHDLRQPLQVIEGAHEFLGRGVRTASELRLLQFAQRATDRLRDQLDELVAGTSPALWSIIASTVGRPPAQPSRASHPN
jgi:signal transduction histidine kinase